MYDQYFKLFAKLYKNNLLPNKILLTGQSGLGKSTFAYQHHGLGVKKRFINYINKEIMGTVKPDYTFLMFLNVNKLKSRISNRKTINRYDKFKKSFYRKVQNGFLKIYNKNKSKYMIIDSSRKFETNQSIIFNQVKKLIK